MTTSSGSIRSERTKELVALEDGYRESAESWAHSRAVCAIGCRHPYPAHAIDVPHSNPWHHGGGRRWKRMRTRLRWRPIAASLVWLALAVPGLAQELDMESEEESPGWSNATELSVVRTQGNAATQTFGFKNTLRRNWSGARLRLRVDGVRARTAGERVLVVAPGLRFLPGERPDDFKTGVSRAGGAPDVEQYFVEGRAELTISDRFFWNAGASWDRNHDAGIRNRTVWFGGVGNVWADRSDLSFSTGYGFSYTAREETELDPAKDDRFGGVRVDSDYYQRLGASLELDSDAVLNVNLLSASDYSLNVTNALGVAINDHLSLRVSLQHLYEHRPALEDTVIVARVALIDPDGVPGSGDELFETVAAGGAAIDFGTGQIRKAGLDAIFRTALVISF